MSKKVTDFLLYKWRFALSYLVVTALIIAIIWLGAFDVPGGLRSQELESVAQAGALSQETLDPIMVINAPYYLLQRLSIHLLGVNEFAIKLPSLALATLTIAGAFMLMRSWFKPSVAIITTAVLASSTHFLFMAQDGTPGILFNAVVVWIMVAGMYVTRGKYFHTFWKILGGVLMGVALYLPMGLYIDVAILIVALIHPHIRAIIRRLPKKKLTIALIVGLVAVAPLVYALVVSPKQIATGLLGLPPDFDHLKVNALSAIFSLFGFAATSEARNGILQPSYILPVAAIALIGTLRLLATHYTARSYMTTLLSLILIPMSLLNPDNIYSIFILMIIVIATGFDFLINYWYRLFPRNPYARVAGLIPLCVLVGGLVAINSSQYFSGYTYNPAVVSAYSNDLTLVNQQIAQQKTLTLMVAENERPLYDLAAHYNSSLTVTTKPSAETTRLTATRASARSTLSNTWQLEKIITNNRTKDSNRLYIYKK